MAAVSIASAKTVVSAPIPVGEKDLTAVLVSDKLLGPLLLANLVQLVVFLLRSIWDSKRKQLDDILKKVELIPGIAEKTSALERHIHEKVPTHEQVQIKIYESMHRISDTKRGQV